MGVGVDEFHLWLWIVPQATLVGRTAAIFFSMATVASLAVPREFIESACLEILLRAGREYEFLAALDTDEDPVPSVFGIVHSRLIPNRPYPADRGRPSKNKSVK